MKYFLATLALLAINANAENRMYEFADQASFDSFISDSRVHVLDSIPELKIVLLDEQVLAPARANDIGQVKTIKLDPQSLDSSQDLPAGYWGLEALDLQAAWEFSKGEGVVVAVTDTGIAQSHPDLAANIWKNAGEVGVDSKGRNKATNRVDDDGNGFVDDVTGWDFDLKRPAKNDHHFHGSHVAGTIAAVAGPNIAGVAPKAKLMNVPFINKRGSGSDLDGAKAIVYAANNGAQIINCSWSGEGKSRPIEIAIAYAETKGVLLSVAAGNKTANIDSIFYMPASYDSESLVTVGAITNKSGTRAPFSNVGKVSVDLAAPGVGIRSCDTGRAYRVLSGTSMAAPHLSGVLALVWSLHPEYTAAQVKAAVLGSVVPSEVWAKTSVSGGLLNARNAVTQSLY
jgi:thermitase